MSTAPIIVGLDLDQIPVRLVVAIADEALPYVLEHRSFRSDKQFRCYWNTMLGDRQDVRLAVCGQDSDPLDLLSWLEDQGIPVDVHPRTVRLGWRTNDIDADFAMWNLPGPYRAAYALALYSAYRLHAASVSALQWNNLSRAKEILAEMERELHRLTAALPRPPPAVEDEREVDCPF